MRGRIPRIALVLCLCFLLLQCPLLCGCGSVEKGGTESDSIQGERDTAPPSSPMEDGMSLVDALRNRKSVRSYTERELSGEQVSLLFWAAQGVTREASGFRTAPSAGATYPLELYVLEDGILSHYLPESNSVKAVGRGLDERQLAADAGGQSFIGQAAAVFIVAADFERTQRKYGARGERYVYMEAGHAAQNLLLEATALGLGAVPVGAFDDEAVSRTLGLSPELRPLYIIPVGYPGS